MARNFTGQVAWITGGGSGIGRALAMELSRRGATVAITGRRVNRLEEVAAQIESNGGRALAIPGDVTDETAMHAAARRITDDLGRLDIAVANAGFGISAPFEEIDASMWRRQLDINVVGVAVMLRNAIPHLRRTRGRAAVISSVMGRLALSGSAAYSASKYALVGMCDALYQELHGTGVTITNVMPGLVASEIGQVDNQGVFHPEARDPRFGPLVWPTDRAARVITDAIHRRDREFVFTFHGKVGAFLGQHVPGLLYPMLARIGLRGRGKSGDG